MTTIEPLADYLTQLASKVTEGVIVELGSFHGKGTIALAKEAKVFVFSIDDFSEKRGWINERYGPEDEAIYWKNIEEAGVIDKVIQMKMTVEEAAGRWEQDIGLLYWDLGMRDRIRDDFASWNPHVIEGGLFIIKDTPQDNLGSFTVVKSAVLSGKWVRENYWQGVTFLRRI